MQTLQANKVMKGKVGKQRICHKTKSICLNKCEKVGLTFVRLYTTAKLSNFIFIYETNPSVEDLFTQYYQPSHECDSILSTPP